MPDSRPLHILHIEDDNTVARLVRYSLRKAGYVAEYAQNGVAGLDYLAANPVDAVLLDYDLPDCDGLQLLSKIVEAYPERPVIMLTGMGSEHIAVQAMKLGAAEYLVKDSHNQYFRLLPLLLGQVLEQQRLLVEAQRNADQECRQRDNLKKLFATLKDLILIADAEARILYFNDSVSRELGYTEQELRDMSLIALHPPNARGQAAALFEQVRAGEIDTCPLPLQTKDGRLIPVESKLVTGEWDKRPAVFVSCRDVSQQRRAEAELQAAKEAAEAASQAKSAFLANMSHELRTPLNAVLGYLQILQRDENLNPDQCETLSIVQRNSEYLLTLIDDVLDLAKVEAGKLDISMKIVALSEFLQEVVGFFQLRAAQKGIQFSYRLAPQVAPCIYADARRLRQVLLNLLSNAFKFTASGGVQLRVGPADRPQCVRFEVEDSGCGIAPEDLAKIFQPFYQTQASAGNDKGTGLGLSIARKLTELMGGELHVASQPGTGTRFWLDLFLPPADTASADAPAQPGLREITGFSGPPRSVLVADGNADGRSILRRLLQPLGFTVLEAADARQVLDLARQSRPDAICLDLHLSPPDGLALVRALKQMPELREGVIIATSTTVLERQREACLAAGCIDFVPKPIRLESLLACLQRHLRVTWTYAQAAPKTEFAPEDLREITGLSAEQARALLEYAAIGDIQGLFESIGDLERGRPELRALAEKLRWLAEHMQIRQIHEMLQYYRNQRRQA